MALRVQRVQTGKSVNSLANIIRMFGVVRFTLKLGSHLPSVLAETKEAAEEEAKTEVNKLATSKALKAAPGATWLFCHVCRRRGPARFTEDCDVCDRPVHSDRCIIHYEDRSTCLVCYKEGLATVECTCMILIAKVNRTINSASAIDITVCITPKKKMLVILHQPYF